MSSQGKIPVQAGIEAIKAGRLGSTIESILADLKSEAVYFTEEGGERTAYIFLDMQDSSQIPAVAEPWFLAFNASVEIRPAMLPEDLGRASDNFPAVVHKYGT